jgi:hypothetical protein
MSSGSSLRKTKPTPPEKIGCSGGRSLKVRGIGLVVLLGVPGGVLDEAKLTLSPLGEELRDRDRLPDEERDLM